MSSPYYFAGSDLTSSLLNNAPLPIGRVKLSNHTLNNQANFQTDPELTAPVAANTSWALTTCLIYSASTAADAEFGLSLPSGATHWISSSGLVNTPTGTSDIIEMIAKQNTTTIGVSAGGFGTGTILMCPMRGSITIAATAGSIAIRLSQWTADASNIVLYSGSWMVLTRIT